MWRSRQFEDLSLRTVRWSHLIKHNTPSGGAQLSVTRILGLKRMQQQSATQVESIDMSKVEQA